MTEGYWPRWWWLAGGQGRWLLVAAWLALALGCTPAAPPAAGTLDRQSLLDGRLLAAGGIPPERFDVQQLLALAPDDEVAIQRLVGATRHKGVLLRRLLAMMNSNGFLDMDYRPELTLTASEAWQQRAGNCMAFTALFIAISRSAGLAAQFQLVEVPPEWHAADDLVTLNTHINALVTNVPTGTRVVQRHTVDFNQEQFVGRFPARAIPDRWALALYMSNKGVDALRAGAQRQAFAWLRAAVATEPREPAPWVNLGVLYNRAGRPDAAVAAYRQALLLDPGYRAALTNLVQLHDHLGEPELADHYRAQVSRWQQRNPYFHFSRARAARQTGDLAGASAALDRAMALKGDDDGFHWLAADLALQAGDRHQAEQAVAEALAHAPDKRSRDRYRAALAVLAEGGAPQFARGP